jgi:streptogramin lyase
MSHAPRQGRHATRLADDRRLCHTPGMDGCRAWWRRSRSATLALCLASVLTWPTPVGAAAAAAEPLLRTYTIGQGFTEPMGITKGPDANLWFTEAFGNKIGRLTKAGVVTLYPLPGSFAGQPVHIAAGPDGALWFTEIGRGSTPHGGIGRISTTGTMTEFTNGVGTPEGITTGPDGALWFTDVLTDSVGRITTAGVVTEYAIASPRSFPDVIVVGPDGNLWFTEAMSGKIGRVTPQGLITEFYAEFANNGGPAGITRGRDGALWFAVPNANTVGRITPQGAVTLFPLAVHDSSPYFIVSGRDGNLYYTGSGDGPGGAVGRVDTTGHLTEIPTPDGNNNVTSGPDHDIWFTGSTTVGRIHTAADTS